MYRRILVPLDGSELAERSLALAREIVTRDHAALMLATVIEHQESAWTEGGRSPQAVGAELDVNLGQEDMAGAFQDLNVPSEPRHTFEPDKTLSKAGRYLEKIAGSLREATSTVQTFVAAGDPAHEILEIAGREGVDLVIMATRGRSGLVRGLLGSVTDRVLRESRCPVLVVRSETAPASGSEAPRPSAVILPLDGSNRSETALDYAVAMAQLFETKLVLIRSVRFPIAYSEDIMSPAEVGELVSVREAEQDAQEYLEEMAAKLGSSGLKVETVVGRGHPRGQIVALSERTPNSLIVMATRGASGVTRWIVGSVTDGVIRTAPAPTLVIPPSATAAQN